MTQNYENPQTHEDDSESSEFGATDSSVTSRPQASTTPDAQQVRPKSAAKVVERDQTIISTRPPIYSAESGVFLAPAEIGPTLVGRNLAHFKLLSFVGGGGMGAVFKAFDTMLQRVVAVKVLSRDQGRDDETVKRFQNEAQSTARLDHENIARVYFVGEDDGWYFIVFEFIEGTNLRDLVDASGPLEGQTAYSFTLQIAEALDHASKRDVVHRDIKPSNVLITADGRAKLVDMGLARLHHVHADQDDLTATGVTLGTFDYISPEQARDPRSADVRSDIYSLGCTLFFMLTGRPPFPDGTVLQKLLSHSSDSPPDLAEWRNDIPQEFNLVLQRMLCKKPKDRYQRPSDLIGDLVVIAEQYGWQIMTRGEPIFIAPVRSRFLWATTHLPWTIPVAIFFFFMVFLDPIWLSNQNSPMPRPDFTFVPEFTAATVNNRDLETEIPDDDSEIGLPGDEDVNGFELSIEDNNIEENSSDIDEDELASTETPEPDYASVSSLVVSADVVPSTAGLSSKSLSDAISIANAYSNIERIEIWSNQTIRLNEVLELRSRGLVIAAGEGFRPTIGWLGSDDRRSIFHLKKGELRMERIHFDMRLPSSSIAESHAVFEVAESCRVHLRNCTVTVRNSIRERHANLDNVAVFRILPKLINRDQANLARETKLVLENCAIRGEATVIRCINSIPLNFRWDNGLLVTTERLLEFQGPGLQSTSGTISLVLNRVTAILDQGLASFRSNSTDPNLLKVEVQAKSCIFVTKPRSSLTSWFDPIKTSLEDTPFKFTGEQNYYSDMTSFARFHDVNIDEMPVVNSISRHEAIALPTRRIVDGFSLEYVPWANWPKDERPVNKHLVNDYTLREVSDSEDFSRAMIGFDAETLASFKSENPSSLDPFLRHL